MLIEDIIKSCPSANLRAAYSICPELDTLCRTLNKHVLFDMGDLQTTILHQVRTSNFDANMIANWATRLVHNFANFKAQQREELVSEVPEDLLEHARLGNPSLRQARKDQYISPWFQMEQLDQPQEENNPTRKRAACTIGASSPKRPTLLSSGNRSSTDFVNNLKGYSTTEEETIAQHSLKTLDYVVGDSDEGSTSQIQGFTIGEGETSRKRSWKKDARQKSRRLQHITLRTRESERSRNLRNRHDFY